MDLHKTARAARVELAQLEAAAAREAEAEKLKTIGANCVGMTDEQLAESVREWAQTRGKRPRMAPTPPQAGTSGANPSAAQSASGTTDTQKAQPMELSDKAANE